MNIDFKDKKNVLYGAGATLGLLVLIFLAYSMYSPAPAEIEEDPDPAGEEAVIDAPPEGERTYRISSTMDTTFTEATFNPLDASGGEEQTITVKINSENIINRVWAVIYMGNEVREQDLILVEGETTDGIWEAALTIDSYIWGVDLMAQSGDDESKVELRFPNTPKQ